MNEIITLDKTYRTRDGKDAKLDAIEEHPSAVRNAVRGAIRCEGGWLPISWSINGDCAGDLSGRYDLIEVKPERRLYINVYRDMDFCYGYFTRECADATASKDRIACVEVVFRDGDGL